MKKIWILTLIIIGAMQAQAQHKSAEDICPILVGQELPDAALKTLENEDVKLRDLTQGKMTVIVVYRGGWCPYCNNQLKGLAMAEKDLEGMGYQILAVSPDYPEELGATLDKNELSYTLLSDPSYAFMEAIGVDFQVDEKTAERYKGWGIDLVGKDGEKEGRLPVPTVLVVDKKGRVHFSYANPNYKVRLQEDLLLAAARAATQE